MMDIKSEIENLKKLVLFNINISSIHCNAVAVPKLIDAIIALDASDKDTALSDIIVSNVLISKAIYAGLAVVLNKEYNDSNINKLVIDGQLKDAFVCCIEAIKSIIVGSKYQSILEDIRWN